MRLDIVNAIVSPIARTLARGIVMGMAESWTIEQLRTQAARGADFATLQRANPRFVRSLQHMAAKFPVVREISYTDMEGWVREANPALATAVQRDPEVRAWLRRAWASGFRAA